MNIVFAGTPEFAAAHLRALLQSTHSIAAVFTQPDRPAGRGKKPFVSAVKTLASANNIPVFQPESFKDKSSLAQLRELRADVLVVVAYGLILPKSVLEIPRFGCLNVHASLLPKWRGAAPIQRAIEAGETHTGITIMQMDEGLDTGDILTQALCPIEPKDCSADLLSKLAKLGGPSLLTTLDQIQSGQGSKIAQDSSQSSYAPKITKLEALLDWSQSANVLAQRIRAFNPAPVTYSMLSGERIKIWRGRALDSACQHPYGEILVANKDGLEVACGNNRLLIEEMQLPGKARLEVAQILHSRAAFFAPGSRFGT